MRQTIIHRLVNMNILKTIAKSIKWVFDDPKFLLTLIVTTLFLLLAPPGWLITLGVDRFVGEYRWLISVVFLFAGASFFATVTSTFVDSFTARQIEERTENEDTKEAKNLTEDE
jgi:TctA family transporter